MTLIQINALCKKRDELSQDQREKLKEGILNNPEALETTINGAIHMRDWNLATMLILYKNKNEKQ